MSKRITLLRSVLSFNMVILSNTQSYHKDFPLIAKTVTGLHKRIKRANRKKIVVEQLGFLQNFEMRFRKHKRKTVITETVTASNSRNARKILKEKYGNKIAIIKSKSI